MGRGKKQNPFAARKRQKREIGNPPDRRSEPYKEIERDNAFFIKYYQMQKICATEAEWQQFLEKIRDNLPVTFRVTGFKEEAKALLRIIETQMFTEYMRGVAELNSLEEEQVERPLCLPWYPNGMAYQLDLTRKDIRRSEPLHRLHNFLIVETAAGNISRQEGVSMIPPVVLDVQPTDKVLDMCAAPGSKTAQLIEALHAAPEQHKIPPGFVLANDVDNNRCYMLVHQAKRLNSPCLLVTNHDSSFFPNMLQTDAKSGQKSILKFDKILCDVPCSGDGTLRKNPDIWMKWNLGQAYNLHGVQYRIVRRGAEMLEIGGRLVYSTCSMNPIENEAVVQRIIKDADGALELVDASHLVPGLKHNPGMSNWILATKEVDTIFTNFEEVPETLHTIIRPTMFPLPADEMKSVGIEKCMRILPHMQNTGGFFVAIIEKRRALSFEKNDVQDLVPEPQPDEAGEAGEAEVKTDKEQEKSAPWGPQRKRRRLHGYKEDPYVFFSEEDADYDCLKKFYQLDEAFNKRCLLTRCQTERKKNIYYCSEAIRDLVLNNEHNIKIINTGVKTFVRCENRHTLNPYRLAQEGLQTSNAFIGNCRRIQVERDDLILLLNCQDPTKPPSTHDLKPETQERCKELCVGSCILKYVDESFTLFIVGWRGTSSLRAYVAKDETVHILRMLGGDVSKFEVNKYEKAKEAAAAAAATKEGDDNGEEKAVEKVEEEATESEQHKDAMET